MLQRHGARVPCHEIEALGQFIGMHEVAGGRDHLVAQGQRGEDGGHRTRGTQQVPDGCLGRTDRYRSPGTEHAADRGQLPAIPDKSGRGMGIEILHLAGRQARLGQGLLHRPARAVAVVGPGGDVVRIGGRAVADHLGQWHRATRKGMLEGFEHQHAGALSHHEAIACHVEGP